MAPVANCGDCGKRLSMVRVCPKCGTQLCAGCTNAAVRKGGKCPKCGKVGLKPA